MDTKDAIERVYVAFSDIERPEVVDGCPCCMAAEEYEALTTKPLRELTVGELDEFAHGSLWTMGTEEDYKYYLPRILELTIEENWEWVTGLETTGLKMQMAGFDSWNEKKRAAIENLWLVMIQHFATSDYDPELVGFVATDIDTWLSAATLIPISVSPLLEVLEVHTDIVRTLYNQNFKTIFQDKLDNPYLEESSEGQAEIARWLRNRIQT